MADDEARRGIGEIVINDRTQYQPVVLDRAGWEAHLERQRTLLERQNGTLSIPPSPPPAFQPKYPTELRQALDQAHAELAATEAKLTSAEAACSRARDAAAEAAETLAQLDAEQDRANATLGERLRQWLSDGKGPRPVAKQTPIERIRQHDEAQRDLAAARQALAELEQHAVKARVARDEAQARVFQAARAILSQEAAMLAVEVEALEAEAGEKFRQLHAHAFVATAVAPGGSVQPLSLSAEARRLIGGGGAPRKANIVGSKPQIDELREGIRARFDALCRGALVEGS